MPGGVIRQAEPDAARHVHVHAADQRRFLDRDLQSTGELNANLEIKMADIVDENGKPVGANAGHCIGIPQCQNEPSGYAA